MSDPFSDLTVSGQVLGSPNFMPPEQATAKHGKVGRYSNVDVERYWRWRAGTRSRSGI